MIWTNEELTVSGEDALNSIEIAISELSSMQEYEHIVKMLKEAKEELEETLEPYKERYEEEQIKIQDSEKEYLIHEYMSSRI